MSFTIKYCLKAQDSGTEDPAWESEPLYILDEQNMLGILKQAAYVIDLLSKIGSKIMRVKPDNPRSRDPLKNIFPIHAYRFPETCTYEAGFLRTDLQTNLTAQQMNKVTAVNHASIIALKKISKPRKSGSPKNNIGMADERQKLKSDNFGLSSQSLYMLYYEIVPFSLEASLRKPMINVKPEILQHTLETIKIYLQSLSLCVKFSIENVGVTDSGMVKVYIPVPHILKKMATGQNGYSLEVEQMQRSILSVCSWYEKKYSRNSQPSPTLNAKVPRDPPAATSTKSTSKLFATANKFMRNEGLRIKTQQTGQNTHRKLRQFHLISPKNNLTPNRDKTVALQTYVSEGDPNKTRLSGGLQLKEIMLESKRKEEQNKEERNKFLQQQNINCINIYHNSPPVKIEKVSEKHVYENRLKPPSPHYQNDHHYHDYDNESVDTYQMELGEDYEMPRIAQQQRQRLRQTVLNKNSMKNWDTMSSRTKGANPSSPKGFHKSKITESAGFQDFQRIIEKNRKMFMDSTDLQGFDHLDDDHMQGSERETVFKRGLNGEYHSDKNKHLVNKHPSPDGKNWQYQTIRSSCNQDSPDIQDRVQKALLKTKSVMSMLKNCRNLSAGN